MKRVFFVFLVLFIFLSNISNAQEEYEHLFKDRRLSFSIMFGPLFEFSSVHNNFGFSAGGGAALLLNQSVFVGAYMLNLSPVIGRDVEFQGVNYDNMEIAFRHSGIWLGYIHKHHKLVHFGGSMKFGWGNISLEDGRLPASYVDNVMVITPQADVEVNVSHWFRVNLGVGYRLTTGVNETVFEQSHFNSPVATLGFMLGWFR